MHDGFGHIYDRQGRCGNRTACFLCQMKSAQVAFDSLLVQMLSEEVCRVLGTKYLEESEVPFFFLNFILHPQVPNTYRPYFTKASPATSADGGSSICEEVQVVRHAKVIGY